MNKTKVIVGIGEILWDVFPQGKQLGGAPANFAYHVSQFGHDGYAISAIGQDELGDEIVESLKDKNLNCFFATNLFPTGTVQVTLDEKGVPQYEICENVAWDNIPFTAEMEKLARQTDAVCFGSLAQRSNVSRASINLFLNYVPASALIIFDINLRQHFYSKQLIEDSLKFCNILKINNEEIRVLAKLLGWESISDVGVCAQLINDYDLKIVVLTCGEYGSYVVTPTETLFKETPKVKVADTVGAGDTFTATFVTAMLNGNSISEAHQLAVDVSAYVCTQAGAMPVLPKEFLNRSN
jgi:fructokinase